MKFAENLRKEGVRADVVSTPGAIAHGCGLSVKVLEPNTGKKVLAIGKYSSYTGLYQVKNYNGTLNIIKK